VSVNLLDLAVEVRLLDVVVLGRDAILLVDLLASGRTRLGVLGPLAVGDVTLDGFLAETVVDDVGDAISGIRRSGAEPKGGPEEEVVETDRCGERASVAGCEGEEGMERRREEGRW
jgi:hypothetical protein